MSSGTHPLVKKVTRPLEQKLRQVFVKASILIAINIETGKNIFHKISRNSGISQKKK